MLLVVSALETATANDGYMTTYPELGLQPNSFPGSTNRLAIRSSEDTRRVWEGGYTLS